MPLQMVIAGVVLRDFEVPEKLPVPWKQSAAVNEYAGGVRTAYALGSFPKPVAWQGWLLGASAFARGSTLERVAAVGVEIELSYGPFAWLGLLTEFALDVQHQFKVGYQATFEPTVDLSGISVVAQGAASAEQALSSQLAAMDGVESGASGLALPASLVAAAAAVDSSVAAALLGAGGIVSAFSAGDLSAVLAATAGVAIATANLYNNPDATIASPAIDLAARAAAVGAIAGRPQSVPRRLQGMVNPNLFAVAARYLSDATRWQEIATLSALPPDPLPVGIFTLVVPAQ